MLPIPYIRNFFHAVKKTAIDDFFDRLCYFYTASIFIVFAIMTGSRQLFGDPIECIMPAEFPDSWVRYVRQYCYITSTYFLPVHESWSSLERQSHTVETYYQWVPFILLFQAFLMYLPHTLWQHVQASQDISFDHVVRQAKNFSHSVAKPREDGIRDVVAYIKQRFAYQGTNQQAVSHVGFGSKSVFYHMMFKGVMAMFLFIQLVFMNQYFGRGASNYWGFSMFYNAMTNIYWEESGIFPRVTFCDFYQPALGSLSRRTVQCVLMMNMVNEKIFVFIWIWLATLFVSSLVDLCHSIIVNYSPMIRRWTTRRFLSPLITKNLVDVTSDVGRYALSKIDAFSDDTLGPDGIHLLRLIRIHAGTLITAEICCKLYDAVNPEEEEVVTTIEDAPASNDNEGEPVDDDKAKKTDLEKKTDLTKKPDLIKKTDLTKKTDLAKKTEFAEKIDLAKKTEPK